jgi:phosphate transport system substrate-binding protein
MTTARTGEIERVNRFGGSSNRNVSVTLLQHQPRIVRIDPPVVRHGRFRNFPYNSQGDCIMPSCIWAWAIAVLLLLPSAPAQTINGAGATFPYPLYGQWFDAFQSAHRGVEINYRPVGSGSGVTQLLNGEVDFGASDMPLTDEQLAEASAKLKTTVLHFPMVLGAAVPAYNLAGLSDNLKFTPEVLSGIFLGSIRQWDAPAIAKINPGVKLPSNNIAVIHRAEGSGTSYCWTDYLSKVDPEWQKRVGKGTTVPWPVGTAARGNDGVAALVKQTPYAMGYVELSYALLNHIPFGSVRNSAGVFVRADLASVEAAAASVGASIPDHFRVSITNAPGPKAYPISTFTWLLVPAKGSNAAARKALVAFLRWALTDGQRLAPPLQYSPLPKELAAREIKALAAIQ